MLQTEIQAIYRGLENDLIAIANNNKLKNLGDINKLKKEYNQAIDSAYTHFGKVLDRKIVESSHKNYRQMLKEIEKDLRHNITSKSIEGLTKDQIRSEFRKSIGGRTIDQRLKLGARNLYQDTTKALQNDVLESIRQHQSRGDSIDKMTRTIREQLHTDNNRARRIARTESHRMREFTSYEAQREAQKYEMFKREWLSTQDLRTRAEHIRLNGRKEDEQGYFKVGDWRAKYPSGFGVAKMDIHCRCTVISNFDDIIGDADYEDRQDLSQSEWELSNSGLPETQERVLMQMLDPNKYPFEVAMEVMNSPSLKGLSDKKFEEKALKEINKQHISYIKDQYKKYGVELDVVRGVDSLTLADQQKLFMQLQEIYPTSHIKKLSWRAEGGNASGWLNPITGEIRINTSKNQYLESPQDQINKGWWSESNTKFNIHQRTLVHEYAHMLDFDGDSWKSSKLDRRIIGEATMVSGAYARTSVQETVAEAFVNATTSKVPKEANITLVRSLFGYFTPLGG
jgi:SPP1 gp7 family putative phage head morphogenesis protein